MRPRIVAGNWKMNTDLASAEKLVRGILGHLDGLEPNCTLVVCPPFVALTTVGAFLHDGRIALGAQHLHFEEDGAFTGEVSAAMLKSAGCTYVIIGHSERRQLFGETDASVNRRINAALRHGLKPIVCVGETLEDREANRTTGVIARQLAGAFADIAADAVINAVIAYEPVWAIGTGRNATPDQVTEVHTFIRSTMESLTSLHVSESIPILYGGSVNAGNAAAIFAQPNVDGGLIGGASLKPEQFIAIARAWA